MPDQVRLFAKVQLKTYARQQGVPLAFVDGIRPDLTPDRVLYALKEGLAHTGTLADTFHDFEHEYEDYLIIQEVLHQGGGVPALFDVVGSLKDPAGFGQIIGGLGRALTENTRRTLSNRFALERYLRGVETALAKTLSTSLHAAQAQSSQPLTLLIDTYEEMEGLDDWVCRTLMPALPAGVKVVVLGHNALPKVNLMVSLTSVGRI